MIASGPLPRGVNHLTLADVSMACPMRVRSLSRLALLPVLAVLALALAPSSAQPQDPPQDPFDTYRQRFDGEWELATPPGQARTRIDAAIEQTVGAMNFFVRSVARGQLQENTPINRTFSLRFTAPDRIRIRFDTGWTTTTRVGRTGRARSLDGDEMRVTQRFRDDGTLEQVFQTDQGTRWNVYTSTGEGTLRVDATTQGMMMPQPMRFSLEYRRRP